MKYTSLPAEGLQPWAFLNNIQIHGVTIQSHILDEDGNDKGGGIVASDDRGASDVLIEIPHDLILNRAAVEMAARSDRFLREVLDAVGKPFLETSRRVVMIFLLLQLSHSSPSLTHKSVGIATPWTDYVKFLPKNISLPTMWNAEQQGFLSGTSAEAALDQKLDRLRLEFDHIKKCTESIQWCQNIWWAEGPGLLNLNDWKLADALYRSRAFELPSGVGESMLPVLDMANHSSGDRNNARFQIDDAGNAQLVVRNDSSIRAGDEVTITYGYGGACEMIFSYGFLAPDIYIAKELFLGLEIPDDDPLKTAKAEFAREAPGVKIYVDDSENITWESPLVWWACVNQEDGLDFQVLKQIDGSMELKATWKGSEFVAEDLRRLLTADQLRDVFMLRALVLVQDRVEAQGRELSLAQEAFDRAVEDGNEAPVVDVISRLRDLEMDLLAASYQALEQEKLLRLDSATVRSYLSQGDPGRTDGTDEDFS